MQNPVPRGYIVHLIDYLEGKARGIKEKLVRKPRNFSGITKHLVSK